MTGGEAVLALVLIEWTGGLLGIGGWTQSWSVVRRGHFRILAWCTVACGIGAVLALRASTASLDADLARGSVVALALLTVAYLGVQYSRTDVPGAVVGVAGAAAGVVALAGSGALLRGWPSLLAAAELLSGMVLLGAVTNGMLLGHWYLNQPGLQPWALARLTDLALYAVIASGVLGLLAAGRLAGASTEGAVLGLPGFGASFSVVFFIAWLAILALTGAVAWMARRCVKIRSIQSATGLFYVALLTAGVSEFLVRYLMVNA
ncbi:MAG: hypothetical protein M3238_06240 [Actinomycetota bacterium]|nr:hypothetical protein [Actinomycetota bacterium]